MEQSVEKIIERNLLEVFNARDADSRRAAIGELGIRMVIDPGGVHDGVPATRPQSLLTILLFTSISKDSDRRSATRLLKAGSRKK